MSITYYLYKNLDYKFIVNDNILFINDNFL